MIFSSVEFLLYFLPIFMILYGITPKSLKNVTLLVGSIVFYAYGEPQYLLLLMISVLANYFLGLHLSGGRRENSSRNKKRKVIFITAIAVNVSVLVLFKGASGGAGFSAGIGGIGLPLGISFYTFQIISYLIDVYRGDIRRERSFLRLASYVTMFPQLISGPIVNYDEVSEALRERRITAAAIQDGAKVFILGLSAKVLLADRIGILWREVQTTGFESITVQMSWLAAIAYSMKIYFDFYGYSLMAVGLGRMLGFELPENFNAPYMAGSVRDFYRRWHMTLGRWFCRYVYIPMGGSRRGEARTILNLLAVWVLTAVWHGSTPNFLIWGMGLCLLIILERQFARLGVGKYMKVLPHLYVWFVIPISWMCFAITDVGQLQVYLGRMFGLNAGININAFDWQKALSNYGVLLLICFLACTPLIKRVYEKIKNRWAGLLLLGSLFWLCVWRLMSEGGNPFMYFRF